MKNRFFLAILLLVFHGMGAFAQSIDVQSDTWVCDDGLGRTVASSDGGVDRAAYDDNCLVGIFYYVWHDCDDVKDVTRLLEANVKNPAWGPEHKYHWGGKPAMGYYAGGDPFIVARHMQMLMDAGVDFYFFDTTNAVTYDSQIQVVMDEIDRREKLGLKVPKLVFTTHTQSVKTVQRLYDKWYTDKANDKYWLYWDGKPLILVNEAEEADFNMVLSRYFTMRYCWAWEPGLNRWPWLENSPQQINYTLSSKGTKVFEQMTVATAQHPYSKIGKSYHNGKQPPYDAYGLCKETPYGYYFQEQFDLAIRRHPKVLMITQWNEWEAMRFIVKKGEESLTRPGGEPVAGESYFVDVYNQEFNRDIEPSSESLIRDNYYLQMVSNVRKYKGVHAIPVPTHSKTIDPTGDIKQWDDVQPEFLDEPGDVYYTSTTAQKAVCRKRKSNDIICAKVSKDADSLYFMAKTSNLVIYPTNTKGLSKERWMTLLLNADGLYTTGWEGYDFMITRNRTEFYLFAFDASSGEWKQMNEVRGKRYPNHVVYAVSREEVGLTQDVDFDFKWVDNVDASSLEILDFISNGEAAPNGRFNYRYKGSALPTAIVPLRAPSEGLPLRYDLSGRPATSATPFYIQNKQKFIKRK